MQTFTATRQQFEKMRADLAAEGVSLTGDSGTIGKMGCKLAFAYVEPTLTVTVLHGALFIGEHTIEKEVDKWFGQEAAG